MKALLFVLQILPALIEALKAIENLWPEAKKGTEKLELLKGILETAYPTVTEMWPTIEKVVAVLVGWLNKQGIFKKD